MEIVNICKPWKSIFSRRFRKYQPIVLTAFRHGFFETQLSSRGENSSKSWKSILIFVSILREFQYRIRPEVPLTLFGTMLRCYFPPIFHIGKENI